MIPRAHIPFNVSITLLLLAMLFSIIPLSLFPDVDSTFFPLVKSQKSLLRYHLPYLPWGPVIAPAWATLLLSVPLACTRLTQRRHAASQSDSDLFAGKGACCAPCPTFAHSQRTEATSFSELIMVPSSGNAWTQRWKVKFLLKFHHPKPLSLPYLRARPLVAPKAISVCFCSQWSLPVLNSYL